MTHRSPNLVGSQLVLSLFPGIGLLDMAFQEAGFCVVRGPDLIHGGDMREFRVPPAGRLDGLIAGPPCQGFSVANTQRRNPDHPSVRQSLEMLDLTADIIHRCRPRWALVENVPTVPTLRISGYTTQRIAINDFECGGKQLRWRAVQWLHAEGWHLRPKRVNDRSPSRRKGRRPVAVTTKPSSRHMTFADQCRRQGLSQMLELPGWSREARFRAVGNGVPLSIGRVLAAAVSECESSMEKTDRVGPHTNLDCACGCGRPVAGGWHRSATAACRKRLQLSRESLRSEVNAVSERASDYRFIEKR